MSGEGILSTENSGKPLGGWWWRFAWSCARLTCTVYLQREGEREREKERQTDRQTYRHRWKHYLLGGGKKHQYYVPCGTWCRRLWWWAGGTWRAVPAEVAGSRGRRPGTVCKHRRSRWTPAHLCLSPPQPCRLPPSRHRPLPVPSPTSPVTSQFIHLFIHLCFLICLSVPILLGFLGSWVISLTVLGASITNLNEPEPPRAF